MCGIAGRIGHFDWRDNAADRALTALSRRGPDQCGVWHSDCVELIHARLAVVDTEHGLQPMKFAADGNEYILVYNGELYNTEDLRRKLLARGHRFSERSDTEVLLHSYIEWGEKCVDELNGIFAFAVWSVKTRTLFIARDRIGVKPLFYAFINGVFYFGSEIKALLALGVPAELDANGVAELILLAPGRTPGYGVFKGIEELKPGHFGVLQDGKLQTSRYWKLTDREHLENFNDTKARVRELVYDAIKRQLVSDVPLCTFLSGGLDSSVISSIAARELGELHTFSVDYIDNDKYFQASKFQPNSDAEYIAKMNRYLGETATHHRILLRTEDLADALYDAVDARDLPGMADVDSSLLLFCKEIKKQATVALSGECADEIFGGYPWYRDETIRNRAGFPWAQSTEYRNTFIKPQFSVDAEQFVAERYNSTIADTDVLPNILPNERRLREMVRLNFDWFMQTLLDRKDRMSMYSGLEVRVPFCDHRIAEYLYSVPWEFKDYKGREKGLLREAVTGLLPDDVLWRKKSPYPKTHNPQYLAIVSERLRDVLSNPNAPLTQIVCRESLENLLDSENSLNVPWYGQLMTQPQTIAYFLQLNYWLEMYRPTISA